jgi:hypothetical protein
MPSQKKSKKPARSRSRPRNTKGVRTVPVAVADDLVVEMAVPKPTSEVVTEKTYITTEPEVEVRTPGTLAQALTEPAVAVVKPKSRVRKEVTARTRRSA